MISRAVDTAPVEVLEEAHALIEQHFLSVTASGSLENAAEQRVLGVLWAEVETALDQHKKQQAHNDSGR